jgi:hypothetical protein
VHFVERRQGTRNNQVPQDLAQLLPAARLTNILAERRIRAFPVFGSGELPVVCFSECTPAGVETLLNQGRYGPLGIGFDKDFVFGKGGGPALYVRGDELAEWRAAEGLPDTLRARATKLWPGRDYVLDELDAQRRPVILTDYDLDKPSEWMHEREWRVLGAGDPPGFMFDLSDVAFILLSGVSQAQQDALAQLLGTETLPPLKTVDDLLGGQRQAS